MNNNDIVATLFFINIALAVAGLALIYWAMDTDREIKQFGTLMMMIIGVGLLTCAVVSAMRFCFIYLWS